MSIISGLCERSTHIIRFQEKLKVIIPLSNQPISFKRIYGTSCGSFVLIDRCCFPYRNRYLTRMPFPDYSFSYIGLKPFILQYIVKLWNNI